MIKTLAVLEVVSLMLLLGLYPEGYVLVLAVFLTSKQQSVFSHQG